MAKRKVIRKSNRPFTYNPHYYSWGGDFKAAMGGTGAFDLKNTFSGGNVAGMLKGGVASGIGSAVGNIAGGAISGGLESGAGSAISNIGGTIGGAVSAVNPVLGGIISAGSGIIGGLTNRMFGSKLNEEKIAEVEGSNKAINTVMVDNSSADSVMDQWANQDFGADFSKSDIGKDGWFSNKAKNKYKELKKQQDIARNRALTSYENAAEAADTQSDLNVLANFAAYGGQLGSNSYGDGGNIHIKPSKRGTFIAAATKHGKSVQEFASQVLANKENYSPAMVKKANFARNASKWKHADGGPLKKGKYEDWYKTVPADRNDTTSYNLKRAYELAPYDELEAWRTSSIKDLEEGKNHLKSVYLNPNTGVKDYDLDMSGDYYKYVPKKKAFGGDLNTHGADFTNGQIIVGNGGTHEENPMEGVPMGMDVEGIPNLVEQGEVIFNDYVFSNRLFADGGLLESFNLPKSYDGHSFAAIAEKLGDESKERPNDPISKSGLLSSMSRLQQAQETVRQQTQEGQKGVQYAHGGRMGTLFDGLGNSPNLFDGGDYSGWRDYSTLLEPINAEDLWKKSMTGTDKGDNKSKLTQLRYAPVVGAAIGLGQNLFSRPDYSSANAILEAANQAGNYTPIGYTPIGNYLQYRPFDRNFYLNRLNAQAGATRRAIMNTTSPSRNAALLAADYNAQGRLGDLARQAEEYNLAQRQAVETFNRATNQANAEMGLKAAMANQEAALKTRSSRLSGVAQAMAVRDAVDARRGASMSANLTNLFDSLGNIGIDAYNREDRDKLIRAGVFGTLSEKPQEWSDKTWKEYKDYINKSLENKTPKVKGKQHSKGGYLTIKKGKQHGKF